MIQGALIRLTGGNVRLLLGYLLDIINSFPSDLRLALITGLARGYGLEIRAVPDAPETIEIDLVQRYEPLAKPKRTSLVVPKHGQTGLILPNDPRYYK